MTPPPEKLALSGARKAAILLTVLGEDSAATVFRNLDEKDLQRVADEVAGLGTVPVELSIQVFEEYQRLTEAQDFIVLDRKVIVNLTGLQSEAPDTPMPRRLPDRRLGR